MKKRLSTILCLLLALTMAVGCSGLASAESAPISFTYGIDSDIDDFNPMTNQMTNYVCTFVFNVYEPLMHLNGNMEYTMDLATAYEQVDDLTYTFTLREGVKFHNGQDFSADDVINTINYIKDESNGAWRAPQYSTVADVTADGNVVTITLTEPTPAFLDSIAYTPIFCKDDDPAELSTTANGTGAFKFVSWTPNDQIVLEKFAEYWDADAVSITNLTLKPSPDYTVAITNLQAGDLDGLNRVTVENATTIESKDGLKIVEAASSNTLDQFEIGRHNCAPLSDPKVMEAMLLAFDAESINAAIY